MKTRNGFVSNSSTSSFMFYGIQVDKSKIKIDKGRLPEGFGTEDLDDEYAVADIVDEICNTAGLGSSEGEYESVYSIGLCPSSIGGDETGDQFKARSKRLIEETFPELGSVKCGWISEAWYNG